MGKDKEQYDDFQDHHQSLGCPPRRLPVHQGPQPRPQSTGHHPSQENHLSSHKGDGKGSCTLPGILNERGTVTLQTSLKVSSGANGFKVMDPFDWTKDKSIYQRWQLWSEKARLALDAMEGDLEKTKISYFHHWINGEAMVHIESWKNSKTLLSQSAYDELEKKEGKYSSECIESYFTLNFC